MSHKPMLNAQTLLLTTAAWFFIYFLAKVFLRQLFRTQFIRRFIPPSSHKLFLDQGPSYLVSTIHALYVTPRGIQHLSNLIFAPLSFKLLRPRVLPDSIHPSDLPYYYETVRVVWTNLILAGYLLADLVHVIRKFPKLGHIDTVIHHLIFFLCALIAGHYELYPFMFGWLITGEMSTPFLNLRWALIKAGYGSTIGFTIVQVLFALAFVGTRFFVYGAGMAYQISLTERIPADVPIWAAVSTSTVVVIGFLLNLVWLFKIVKMILGRGKRTKTQTNQSTDTERTQSTQDVQSVSQIVKGFDQARSLKQQ